MSVAAGNALAIPLGNPRVVHGEDLMAELSEQTLVQEIAEVYPGMMIAPPTLWPSPIGLATAELVCLLRELAANVPVHRMLRSARAQEEEEAGDFGANDPPRRHQEAAGGGPRRRPLGEAKATPDKELGYHRIFMFTGVSEHGPPTPRAASGLVDDDHPIRLGLSTLKPVAINQESFKQEGEDRHNNHQSPDGYPESIITPDIDEVEESANPKGQPGHTGYAARKSFHQASFFDDYQDR